MSIVILNAVKNLSFQLSVKEDGSPHPSQRPWGRRPRLSPCHCACRTPSSGRTPRIPASAEMTRALSSLPHYHHCHRRYQFPGRMSGPQNHKAVHHSRNDDPPPRHHPPVAPACNILSGHRTGKLGDQMPGSCNLVESRPCHPRAEAGHRHPASLELCRQRLAERQHECFGRSIHA